MHNWYEDGPYKSLTLYVFTLICVLWLNYGEVLSYTGLYAFSISLNPSTDNEFVLMTLTDAGIEQAAR